MFLFSTIVYFGENPIGYDLYRDGDVFWFKPAMDSHDDFELPEITAVYSHSNWNVEGTKNKDIIEQAKKNLELNELISVLNVAS